MRHAALWRRWPQCWRFCLAFGTSPPRRAPTSTAAASRHCRTHRRLARALEHWRAFTEEHKGQRLLISGVNRIVTDDELLRARSTSIPNSHNAASILAVRGGLRSATHQRQPRGRANITTRLILVTDDYHMPRSHAELVARVAGAEIYPIRCAHAGPIPRSGVAISARRGGWPLNTSSIFVIRGREAVIDLGRGEDAAGTTHEFAAFDRVRVWLYASMAVVGLTLCPSCSMDNRHVWTALRSAWGARRFGPTLDHGRARFVRRPRERAARWPSSQ